MNGEILSIETVQKISQLEKEKLKYEKIICNFDKEVNIQFKIIQCVRDFIYSHTRKDKSLNLNEYQTRELLNILNKMNEVRNV